MCLTAELTLSLEKVIGKYEFNDKHAAQLCSAVQNSLLG